jgi:hypothetical protein
MEDGECIETRLVPLSQLLGTLNRTCTTTPHIPHTSHITHTAGTDLCVWDLTGLMREEGMTVDAKVWTFACGLNFAQSFPLPRP